nr:innexin inx2-like [Lepeophtheirus salmonis]
MFGEIFSNVRYMLKSEDIAIDNWIFKLHYRFSVLILITSSIIGVAKQYFGDPINCQTATGLSSKVMDDYCWIHSTFHLRSEFQGNVGCVVDTVLTGEESRNEAAEETPDTAFYQWVPFTLMFQAMLFYIPRKLWKSFEGGLMESFGKNTKILILL